MVVASCTFGPYCCYGLQQAGEAYVGNGLVLFPGRDVEEETFGLTGRSGCGRLSSMSNFTMKSPSAPVEAFAEGDSVVLYFGSAEEASSFSHEAAKAIRAHESGGRL